MALKNTAQAKKYKAIIFDFDGTLMDSIPIVSKAWQDSLLKNFGKKIPIGKIRRELHGSPEESYKRLGKLYPGALHPEKFAKHMEDKEEFINESRHKGKFLPGALPILRKCKKAGVKTALVTSAKKEWIFAYPQMRDVFTLFDVFVFSDTIDEQKPHPEPFLFAARAMGVKPEETVSIGDGPSDARGSVSAGMDFFGIKTGATPPSELKKAGAKAVYRDISEFARKEKPF